MSKSILWIVCARLTKVLPLAGVIFRFYSAVLRIDISAVVLMGTNICPHSRNERSFSRITLNSLWYLGNFLEEPSVKACLSADMSGLVAMVQQAARDSMQDGTSNIPAEAVAAQVSARNAFAGGANRPLTRIDSAPRRLCSYPHVRKPAGVYARRHSSSPRWGVVSAFYARLPSR